VGEFAEYKAERKLEPELWTFNTIFPIYDTKNAGSERC
jgi:hypothetical protein